MSCNIGLIGFFGAGAYSDDLIEYTTRTLLLKHNTKAQIDYKWREKTIRGTDPKLLNSFDLIIHAGGSLLGKCNHYPIRDIHSWHNKLKVPLAIFGAGYRYEPNKEPLNSVSRKRLQLLFEKAEVISVRGHKTMQHLKENGINTSKVISLGDPVMACDIKLEMEPMCVMGNVRNTPHNEIKHASNDHVQALMAEIYDWLIEEYDRPLILLSFRNVGSDSDLVGATKTRDMMRNADRVLIRIPNNFKEAVNLMRHATFWFGQRLHPTIFAATQDIPYVGVEYQFDKMIDWASTVGIDGYINTKNATLETFIEKHNRIPRNRRKLMAALPIRIKEINEIAEKIMSLV